MLLGQAAADLLGCAEFDMNGHQFYRFGAPILIGLCLQTGCVSLPLPNQVQTVRVLYSAPEPIQSKRGGTILMKPLVDAREPEARSYIGEIPPPPSLVPLVPIFLAPLVSGRFIVVKNGTSITTTMARGLSEALKEAGYTSISPDPISAPSDTTTIGVATLEGEIREFRLRPA